jgi:hypothetical protein
VEKRLQNKVRIINRADIEARINTHMEELRVLTGTVRARDAQNEYDKGCDELLELKSEEDSVANFTLSYLRDMFSQLKNLSEVVTIHLATDMPLRIEVTPNDHNLEIDLYLAPMIGV